MSRHEVTILKMYIFFEIIVLLNLSTFINTTSLKQIHIVFRHGIRSPTETYKTDPYINYTWPGGWGQLTNAGKLEMYDLGVSLRKHYQDFVPDYYFNEDVKIWSSYSDRCLVSAQAFLAGFFPPRGEQIWNKELLWQPIAVKYNPRNMDNFIAMKAPCRRYDEELENNWKANPEILRMNDENAELYNYLTKHTGQPVESILDVEFLFNTLEIELLHNLTLPSWIDGVNLKRLKEIGSESLASFTRSTYMKRVKGGVFLNRTISEMKTEKGASIYLYAAHDISLVNILRSLGIEKLLKPGFGASLVFELHNNFEIKIYYRDDSNDLPEKIEVPNCGSPCSLGTFEKALVEVLPKDWKKECEPL